MHFVENINLNNPELFKDPDILELLDGKYTVAIEPNYNPLQSSANVVLTSGENKISLELPANEVIKTSFKEAFIKTLKSCIALYKATFDTMVTCYYNQATDIYDFFIKKDGQKYHFKITQFEMVSSQVALENVICNFIDDIEKKIKEKTPNDR